MKLKNILVLMVVVSLLFSFGALHERFNIEKGLKEYNYILDLDEMEKLADDSDKSLEYWLGFFKGLGAGYVSLNEETLYSMIEDGKSLSVDIVGDLEKEYEKYSSLPESIKNDMKDGNVDKFDLIVKIHDSETFDFVCNGLKNRYDEDFYRVYEEENNYVVLDGSYEDMIYTDAVKYLDIDGTGIINVNNPVSSKLLLIGIGYDMEKYSLLEASGLKILFRPINYSRYSDKIVDNFIDSINTLNPEQRYVLFYGKEVAGYPSGMGKLSQYMRDKGIVPVMIESGEQREHLVQSGLDSLVESLDYSAIRAFTMWDFIRERIGYYNYAGAEEIENSLYRAITERNIRFIYFKPYMDGDLNYSDNEQLYVDSFASLEERLQAHGIILGEPSDMGNTSNSIVDTFIMSLGIVAIGIYLINGLVSMRSKTNIALAAAAVSLFGLLTYLKPDLAKVTFALLGAVCFSSLAAYVLAREGMKIGNGDLGIFGCMSKAARILVVCTAIALMGGLYSTSFLSETKFMLEMDIFRGVKISQIIPIAAMIVFYLEIIYKDKDDSIIKMAKRVMMSDIKIIYVVIGLVLAYVGYIYISRTGHETSVQPSDIEMISRNFLERVLPARPRTKEFLIAFPALYAMVYFLNKGFKILGGIMSVGAVIGLASIVNTFSHIRSPLYLSVVRSGFSLAFGIVLGCVALVVIDMAYKTFCRYKESLDA
ncbi:hypothetical protein SAMN02745751_00982 [Dethiosulfatibacter aminovorans DSM 17477]|uniref:Uncharacterized protein n=1 Tax=Dethiosulfatibacter aminovorans DSM 17477 TaxID=1121476 RepID=A0A1M6DN09_9FIRM|nr:DUF5693 family protein [Dethiosulfatibacter aminovorans]SHI74674.1 hypothetical protein SAMN02745751_00982 [Dethiosulfatibacter aminovorans DSM 17477]